MSEANPIQPPGLLSNVTPFTARKGSVNIMTIRGVPVYLHWSLLASMLPITVLSGFDLRLSLYLCLSLAALIVIHELGHIAAAASLRTKVYALHISFLAGRCVFEYPRSVREVLIVYSGGFIAQGILLALTVSCVVAFGRPQTAPTICLVVTFTVANIMLLVFNLVPFGKGTETDGTMLWKLYLHVAKGYPHPFPDLRAPSPVFTPDTRLVQFRSMVPAGFTSGIELLNDGTTPMEFVVSVLARYLSLEREHAIAMMLKVHGDGGMLIPIEGMETAQAIAAAIGADARAAGHPLICRAVDAC